MNQQTISVDIFGRVSGLVHRNQLDLTKLKAKDKRVERASDIRFSEDDQKWYIHYLIPPFAGRSATYMDLKSKQFPKEDILYSVMYFDNYEEAVQVEIALFNKFRKEGLVK